MRLPRELEEAVAAELRAHPQVALARATAEMSEGYRAGRTGRFAFRSDAYRAAYLATRLPATFAATRRALAYSRELAPEPDVRSLLDLGAGPGTAGWAAVEVFPELERVSFVERDPGMVALGRRLAEHAPYSALREAEWRTTDLGSALLVERFDLTILSYALGELPTRPAQDVLRWAWEHTAKWLAVIEPGTRPGFEVVIDARQQLLSFGAHVLAPCPHGKECPMQQAGDWCHFAVRLERSGMHRRLKQGDLGYEDEKFSYVIAGREAITPAAARVVRHPMRHSGYTQLTLCGATGLERVTVTRSQKELYRAAKKAEWGDSWRSDRVIED